MGMRKAKRIERPRRGDFVPAYADVARLPYGTTQRDLFIIETAARTSAAALKLV
jgi:hypothetical protein